VEKYVEFLRCRSVYPKKKRGGRENSKKNEFLKRATWLKNGGSLDAWDADSVQFGIMGRTSKDSGNAGSRNLF